MNKKVKTGLIIGGVTLGILGIAYLLYKLKYKKVDPTIEETTDPVTGSPCPSWPLMKGSGMGTRSCEQPYVELVQNYLNRNDLPIFSLLTIDGKFGSNTESALQRVMGKKTVSKSDYDSMKAYVQAELINEENQTDYSGDFWTIPSSTLFG